MKVLMIILMPIIFPGDLLSQSRSQNTFNLRARKAGHTVQLIAKTKRFQHAAHNITFADKGYLNRHGITLAQGAALVVKIDRRKPLGVDGSIPQTEIESLRLF